VPAGVPGGRSRRRAFTQVKACFGVPAFSFCPDSLPRARPAPQAGCTALPNGSRTAHPLSAEAMCSPSLPESTAATARSPSARPTPMPDARCPMPDGESYHHAPHPHPPRPPAPPRSSRDVRRRPAGPTAPPGTTGRPLSLRPATARRAATALTRCRGPVRGNGQRSAGRCPPPRVPGRTSDPRADTPATGASEDGTGPSRAELRRTGLSRAEPGRTGLSRAACAARTISEPCATSRYIRVRETLTARTGRDLWGATDRRAGSCARGRSGAPEARAGHGRSRGLQRTREHRCKQP